MRKSRKSLVAVMVSAMALGTAAIAYADGASDSVSQVLGGISPNAQSATKFGAGTLFVQSRTVDADSGPLTIPDKAAERLYVDFDNDIKFDTRKVRKCTADLSLSTTAQAIAACRRSIVGSGQATALVPIPGPSVLELELTVTAFNGPTSATGVVPCLPPGDGVGGPDGCEFVGGKPTLLLHAYNQALGFITVVKGEIQTSPLPGDYGKRLAVTNAPDAAGDAGALTLFNSSIGKRTVIRKRVGRPGHRRTRTTVYNYVSAKCVDDGVADGGKEYDFSETWVYDDASSDTDTYKQKCSN